MIAKLIALGQLCLQLGRIQRATYHEDGRQRESDTDHTVMLSVLACSVAEQLAPHLNPGLVAQYAVVHDFREAHAGDTVSLGIDENAAAEKEKREAAAGDLISAEFSDSLPWLPRMITRYERQADPEARFVRVLDKVMPALTHLLNGGVTIRELGMSAARLRAAHKAQRDKIAASYGADQPEAMQLLADFHEMLEEQMSEVTP